VGGAIWPSVRSISNLLAVEPTFLTLWRFRVFSRRSRCSNPITYFFSEMDAQPGQFTLILFREYQANMLELG
jgi:hypothetical protein